MTAQELFESLESLEKTLQSVESARQQVVGTINAFEGARTQFSKLANDVTTLSLGLNNIFSALQSNQESISGQLETSVTELIEQIKGKVASVEGQASDLKSRFAQDCGTVSAGFSATVDEKLKLFSDTISASHTEFSKKVSDTVTGIQESLAASLQKIQTKLGEEQTAMNGSLEEIKTAANTLQETLKGEISQVISLNKGSLEEAVTAFKTAIAGHLDSFTKLEQRLTTVLQQSSFSEIEKKIQGVQTVVEQTKSSIESHISELKSELSLLRDGQQQSFTSVSKKLDDLLLQAQGIKDALDAASKKETSHYQFLEAGINSLFPLKSDLANQTATLKDLKKEVEALKSQNGTLKILMIIIMILSVLSIVVGFIK